MVPGGIDGLERSQRDPAVCRDEQQLLASFHWQMLLVPFSTFLYNSPAVLARRRDCTIRQRRLTQTLVFGVTQDLLYAAQGADAAGARFIDANRPMPPQSVVRRRAWVRTQWDPSRPLVHQRVDIAIDLPKLKRGSKRFSPAKQMRRLQSDLRSKPQRNVTTAKVDASRSSLQAAPCVTFFTGERINKRNPSLADLPSSWHHTAPPPHTYKCRYDPVHNAIRNRDKSVPLALCIIRIATLMHASRPYIFSRHSSSPQTSGGGRNGDNGP